MFFLESIFLETIERNKRMQIRLKRYNVRHWAKEFMRGLEQQSKIKVKSTATKIDSNELFKIKANFDSSSKKIFFLDWFFGIKTHRGQMVMMYYFFSFLFYYLFCVFMAYLIERIDSPELNILEILYLFLLAIPVAIILPFFLLITGYS